MATEILQFCPTDSGTNLLTQAEYTADSQRTIGNQPGISRSKLVNKAMRQACFIAAGLATYVTTKIGSNVLDDANLSALVAQFTTAFSPVPVYSTKTANYTLLATDQLIYVDASGGSFNITLPSAASAPGSQFTIIRTDNTLANVVSIVGTISGVADWKLHTLSESYTFSSNGTVYNLGNHATATQWSTPTAITIGAVTTPPTKGSGGGAPTTDSIYWRRDGTDAIVFFRYETGVSTSGSAIGSGNYLVTLPTGLVADTTFAALNTSATQITAQNDGLLSVISGSYGGANNCIGVRAVMYTNTTFRLCGYYGGVNSSWGSAQNALTQTTSVMQGWVRVPILGWKA